MDLERQGWLGIDINTESAMVMLREYIFIIIIIIRSDGSTGES